MTEQRKVVWESVRVFYEDGEKKMVLFRNGETKFMLLKEINNDEIDRYLNVESPVTKDPFNRLDGQATTKAQPLNNNTWALPVKS